MLIEVCQSTFQCGILSSSNRNRIKIKFGLAFDKRAVSALGVLLMAVVTYLNGFRNGFHRSSFLDRLGSGDGSDNLLHDGGGLIHRSRFLRNGYGSDHFGHFLLLLGNRFLTGSNASNSNINISSSLSIISFETIFLDLLIDWLIDWSSLLTFSGAASAAGAAAASAVVSSAVASAAAAGVASAASSVF